MVWLTFLLISFTIVVRNPHAFFRAEFWAEDGINLFSEAFRLGWHSLFLPLVGYHNFASRAIALIAVKLFPMVAVPYVFSFSVLILGAWVFSYFSRPGFSWLLPEAWKRMLACWLISFGPGTGEALQAICNFHYVICFFVMLLLLENPCRITLPKFSLFIFLFLSSADCSFTLPLMVFVAWRKKEKKLLYLALALIIVVIINMKANSAYLAMTHEKPNLHLKGLLSVSLDFLFTRFFIAPFFSYDWLSFFLKSKAWIYFPIAFLTVSAWAAYFYRKRVDVSLLVGAFCSLGFVIVTVVFRPYYAAGMTRQVGSFFLGGRYALVPGAWAILSWLSLLRGNRILWPLCACLMLVQNIFLWKDIAPRPDLHWPDTAKRIVRAKSESVGPILVQPRGYAAFWLTIE
jgi:hypothetical protein